MIDSVRCDASRRISLHHYPVEFFEAVEVQRIITTVVSCER